jgi:hypothetical protein
MCHIKICFVHLGVFRVAPHVLSNTHNENHEENIPSVMYKIFHDGMAYWSWSLVPRRLSLAGLCISFTIGWLNEICLRYCASGWVAISSKLCTNEIRQWMLCVRKGIELVAGLICPLPSNLSRFASTARRGTPFKSVQRSFCTVCHWNDRLWGSLKNWTMNF